MRIKRIVAFIFASLFAATAIACASVPEGEVSPNEREESDVPNGYF